MPRKFQFSDGEYYHIYNRGVDKRIIFETLADRSRFQKLLYICNGTNNHWLSSLEAMGMGDEIYFANRGTPLVDIGAYCILGSHFHLLVRARFGENVSLFMQKISTAYTMYFNRKRQRTGSLFEGRFRAKHIKHNEHLKYLYSYIHLNPVQHIEPHWKERGIRDKKAVKKYLENYAHSSLPDYIFQSDRKERSIIAHSGFPRYFHGKKDYLKELESWLSFEVNEVSPY